MGAVRRGGGGGGGGQEQKLASLGQLNVRGGEDINGRRLRSKEVKGKKEESRSF